MVGGFVFVSIAVSLVLVFNISFAGKLTQQALAQQRDRTQHIVLSIVVEYGELFKEYPRLSLFHYYFM